MTCFQVRCSMSRLLQLRRFFFTDVQLPYRFVGNLVCCCNLSPGMFGRGRGRKRFGCAAGVHLLCRLAPFTISGAALFTSLLTSHASYHLSSPLEARSRRCCYLFPLLVRVYDNENDLGVQQEIQRSGSCLEEALDPQAKHGKFLGVRPSFLLIDP